MAMLLNNESDVIKNQLDSLWEPEHCDVKIVASDGDVPANKTILSIRSQYFRSMFSNHNNFGWVEMPYSKVILEKVVIYLYCGKMSCEELTLGSLLDLLDLLNLTNLAEEYGVVEKYTISKIKKGDFSLSDCLTSLDFSRLGRTVREALLAHLADNFVSVSKDERMEELYQREVAENGRIIKKMERDVAEKNRLIEEMERDHESCACQEPEDSEPEDSEESDV